jgi:hypothetical protein
MYNMKVTQPLLMDSMEFPRYHIVQRSCIQNILQTVNSIRETRSENSSCTVAKHSTDTKHGIEFNKIEAVASIHTGSVMRMGTNWVKSGFTSSHPNFLLNYVVHSLWTASWSTLQLSMLCCILISSWRCHLHCTLGRFNSVSTQHN